MFGKFLISFDVESLFTNILLEECIDLAVKYISYKIGLIRTLIDRVFKINNTWLGFHKDIAKLVFTLRKNPFPVHLIDKCVHRYLNTAIDRYGSTRTPSSSNTSQGKQYFYN